MWFFLLLHFCTTYTYIYTYIFLFSRYENAVWICIADSLGYCQWWAAMHNAALSVAHLHLLRHTLSRMHTHRSSHPVPKEICTQSLFRSLCLTYINMSKCRRIFLGRATVRQQRNSTIHLPPSLPINLFADCSRAISAVKPVCIALQRCIFF